MKKILSLFKFQELIETAKRFPVPVACSLILFIYAYGDINNVWDLSRSTKGNFYFSIIIGFFLSGAAHLVNEARGASKKINIIMAVLGLGVAAISVYLTPQENGIRNLTLVYAAIAMVLVAPFIARKSDDLSFWSFARQVGFGAVISFIAGLILFGGASGALASIGYLFEIKIDSDVYQTLWCFGATLVAPIYALSFVPKKFDTPAQECHLPPQVGFIANWILAPLVAVYIAILYAYFIKIGVTGDIPKNQLANMIAGFAFAGIALYLVAYPCVIEGKANTLLRLLHRYLFALLVIPTAVMIYAISLRIGEYGFTEKRYIVVVFAIWMVFLVAGFILKKIQLKHILFSFAVLLFLSSVGPWGMTPVSQASQFKHLTTLLDKHEILQEGEIVKTKEVIPFKDRKSISSKLQYLERTKYRENVIGWLTDEQLKAMKFGKVVRPNSRQITNAMGFAFLYRFAKETPSHHFNVNIPQQDMKMIAVNGYDYVLPNMHIFYNKKIAARRVSQEKSIGGDDKPKVTYALDEDSILTITVEGRGAIKFDLRKVVQENHKSKTGEAKVNSESIIIEKVERGMKMRLVFKHISGTIKDDIYEVSNASFALLLDL